MRQRCSLWRRRFLRSARCIGWFAIRTGASRLEMQPLSNRRPVMTVRKLDNTQWRPFFDGFSKLLEGKRAEIEVASLSLGDQVEAEWLPLIGIGLDGKGGPVGGGLRRARAR